MNSRLIVKNIPKNISEQQIKDLFSKQGDVTDVKIIFKDKKNRRFCFVGFKNEKNAEKACKYFNNTYIQTSKITVEVAKLVDDKSLLDSHVWSKYSQQKQKELKKKYQILQKNDKNNNDNNDDDNKNENNQESDFLSQEKARKYQEFVQLMKQSKSVKTSSWADNILEHSQDQQKKKVKNSQKKVVDEQQIIYKEVDISNSKVGMSNKQVHIKFNNDNNNNIKQKAIENIKEKKQEEVEKKEVEKEKKYEEVVKIDSKRLFVLNIPYTIEESELRQLFEKYGEVKQLKIIQDNKKIYCITNKENIQYNKGYCYVTYEHENDSLLAFSQLDNQIVWGRILHVRPAYQEKNSESKYQQLKKLNQQNFNIEQEKTSYKKLKKKSQLDYQTNWSTLFLNQNTIMNYISEKFNIEKNMILEQQDSEEQAVRIALAETEVIQETIQFLKSQKMDLSFLEEDRSKTIRSKKVILVKNIQYEMSQQNIQELFGFYGLIESIILAPNRSIGIVEFADETHANNAFQQLNLFKYKGLPLYLEWAPIQLQSQSVQVEVKDIFITQNYSNILFVKNLNFITDEKALTDFATQNHVYQIKSVKIVKNKDNQSQGYGFIEFYNNEQLQEALKKLQNKLLDNHLLQVSVSQKKQKEEEQIKVKKQNKNQLNDDKKARNKIIVRNVAFEATKKDIQDIFKSFGEIKNTRLPKKLNGQHRGFAFVEFLSVEEAKNAFAALSNTHLYGRKLAIEWADEDESQLK